MFGHPLGPNDGARYGQIFTLAVLVGAVLGSLVRFFTGKEVTEFGFLIGAIVGLLIIIHDLRQVVAFEHRTRVAYEEMTQIGDQLMSEAKSDLAKSAAQ